MRTHLFAVLLALAASVGGPVDSQPINQTGAPPNGTLPAWIVAEWTFLTQGSGRWIADNAIYKSADEPWDAFGIQWQWGPGRTSLTGRLFGITRSPSGAEQDSAPMWEFLAYWDPARRELVLTQFGPHGIYGLGTASPPGPEYSESIQRLYNPDGSTFRVAHRSWKGERENRQQSYDVSETGEWTPRRRYTWKLQ